MRLQVEIAAVHERVWAAIVEVGPFEEWTRGFHEGSTLEGSWEKGAPIRFIAPDSDGHKTGMVTEIADSRKPEFISIRLLGLLHGDIEDLTSDEARRWTPAFENYTLIPEDGATRLEVDVDVNEEMIGIFSQQWPEALRKLGTIAERPG